MRVRWRLLCKAIEQFLRTPKTHQVVKKQRKQWKLKQLAKLFPNYVTKTCFLKTVFALIQNNFKVNAVLSNQLKRKSNV